MNWKEFYDFFIIVWLNLVDRWAYTINANPLSYWDNKLSSCQGWNIKELTISQVHQLYLNQTLTSSELTQCYLNRINKMNPYLNAILEINSDALEIAQRLDQRLKVELNLIGPLHGIPVLIKDNIGTNDTMHTTAGAWALFESKPKMDAKLITKLRKSGAIILGKTNLSEFAEFRSSNAPPGWSSRGGQTKNPYNLSTSPSGSSSGSAVAMAANLAMISLGTESNGSIIGPSGVCAVVGLKPSVGFTSNQGVIPLIPSQDSIGAITRSVIDTLTVTYVIAELPLCSLLDEIYELSGNLLGQFKNITMNVKVGVIRDPYFASGSLPENQIQQLNYIINKLKSSNIRIYDVKADFSSISLNKEFYVTATEFKHYLNLYLTHNVTDQRQNPIKNLQDVIEYNKAYPKPNLKYDQLTLEISQTTTGLNTPAYKYNYSYNHNHAQQTIDNLLNFYKIDVILVPSDEFLHAFSPSAIVGYPIISIPAGLGTNNVPFGISLYGKRGSEPILVYLASQLENLYSRPLPHFHAK